MALGIQHRMVTQHRKAQGPVTRLQAVQGTIHQYRLQLLAHSKRTQACMQRRGPHQHQVTQ